VRGSSRSRKRHHDSQRFPRQLAPPSAVVPGYKPPAASSNQGYRHVSCRMAPHCMRFCSTVIVVCRFLSYSQGSNAVEVRSRRWSWRWLGDAVGWWGGASAERRLDSTQHTPGPDNRERPLNIVFDLVRPYWDERNGRQSLSFQLHQSLTARRSACWHKSCLYNQVSTVVLRSKGFAAVLKTRNVLSVEISGNHSNLTSYHMVRTATIYCSTSIALYTGPVIEERDGRGERQQQKKANVAHNFRRRRNTRFSFNTPI